MNDPLGNSSPDTQAVSRDMLRFALLGIIGVPFMLAGSILFYIAFFKRLRAKHAAPPR